MNKTINKTLLQKHFEVHSVEGSDKFKLKYGAGINSIFIDIPFELNEDCARLAGLMPDGSLIKDLKRVYFHQKKDINKIYLFRDLLLRLFSLKNKIFMRDNRGCTDIFTNSQTLANFFYYILKIPKSDESMRVPNWVFYSSKKVKIAYLKETYDMEGTILKSLREIRFITKDELFALDLKKLLSQLNISSCVRPRIGGTHKTRQYRLSVYSKENFKKFKQIGFRIPFLKHRFDQLMTKYGI